MRYPLQRPKRRRARAQGKVRRHFRRRGLRSPSSPPLLHPPPPCFLRHHRHRSGSCRRRSAPLLPSPFPPLLRGTAALPAHAPPLPPTRPNTLPPHPRRPLPRPLLEQSFRAIGTATQIGRVSVGEAKRRLLPSFSPPLQLRPPRSVPSAAGGHRAEGTQALRRLAALGRPAHHYRHRAEEGLLGRKEDLLALRRQRPFSSHQHRRRLGRAAHRSRKERAFRRPSAQRQKESPPRSGGGTRTKRQRLQRV